MIKIAPHARRITLIVAAGVAARLLLLAVVDPFQNPFGGDSFYYAAGRLDGLRPPLYILFARFTLPVGLWFSLMLQCAFSICVAAYTYVSLGKFWPAMLLVLCPFIIFFDFCLIAESIYVNLLWLGWLFLRRDQGLKAGLLVGLALLTRDTLLLLPLFSLLWLRSKAAARMTASAYVIALPWFLFAATPGRMALNLWIGTWERDGAWMAAGFTDPQVPPYAFVAKGEREEVGKNLSGVTLQTVANHALANPLQVLRAWGARYPSLWLGTRSDLIEFRASRQGLIWTVEKAVFYLLNIALLTLGMCGLFYIERVFLPPVAYAALIHIPFHAEARFTLFAVPFLIVAAVSFVVRVWPARWRYRAPTLQRA
ncbi:hypothetical protein [uncultured Novosphingobium sp.]|uniref:hypothetical protein n=1 Tax=uncultured Novosphingobium sp. TaxID=292277 RepID=UPI00374A4505